MKRISPETYPSSCVTTASALAALVAAVAATAIATAAAVAVISGSGAGSALGSAIFIAAVLAAAASGLLAACIASPPPTPPATISEDTSGRQIVIPLTTIEDGLKTLIQFTKSRQPRPSRRRPPKKRHLPDEPLPTLPPIPKTNSLTSLGFHERCGRILQTCDLLVRHFPASRTLCILRTAEGIIARRPHRPVEPESTWESDIDVDLDPVLSAPDLDEALRRLDQRIRSAKKYKERNERLQSTSLVLEAEKRRAIRSSAEQFLVRDDQPSFDNPSEPITVDDIRNASAAFYPKPKARSSLFQATCPTDSSSHIPSSYKESLPEDASRTLPSTEKDTGFTSSHNDFTSSVVEMNSEVILASQFTSDSFVRINSEILSSSFSEKETENVALSPFLNQNIKDQATCAESPSKTEINISSSTTGENLNLPSNLIENKEVVSTKNEISSSKTVKREESPLPWSSYMTTIAEETPFPGLVAEFCDDDDSENWSSLVEAVACGQIETELVPFNATSINTKDLTSALSGGEDVPVHFGCEKTDVSSQGETVQSHSSSIPEEELTLLLTKGEVDPASSVSNDTDVSPLDEAHPSSSASIEAEYLTPTKNEAVFISSFRKTTDTISPDEPIRCPTSTPEEDLRLPETKDEAVSIFSACDNTDASPLEDGIVPSYSTSTLEEKEETNPSLTKSEDVSSFVCEKTSASSLEETVPTSPTSIYTEDSTLHLTQSETDSASSVCEKTRTSSPPKIAHSSFDKETHDDTFPSNEKTLLSACLNRTENLEAPDITNVDESTTSAEFVTGNKTHISNYIATESDIITGDATASIETHILSSIDCNLKDTSVDFNLTTIKEEDTATDKPTSRRASLSRVKSTLTLDLNVRPSKIEYEFEQLLENISPPTDDIEETFTAVSSDILTPDENISEEGKRIDTCISTSVDNAKEVPSFSSHVAEAAMERIKDSEILISDGERKLYIPDPETLHEELPLERPGENTYLREHTPLEAHITKEEHRDQDTKVMPCISSANEDFIPEPEKPVLRIEEIEAVANLERTLSFNETESKFDREIQSLYFNLGTEEKSDCASDSSSMSVSPNPDISLLRTYETNSTVESFGDAIKLDFPVEKKELSQQTTGIMDNFGFGEPLMVVTARKVTTYVDDVVCPTQRKERNFAQKRRVRISTEDFDSGDMSDVRERKVGLVGSSLGRRGSKTSYNFEPVCLDVSPSETNIRKPLKPEALRPFRSDLVCVKDEEAVPGHFFRSLERREETQPSTFDHSSSFPLSMRVPHRRAFWDYKMKEQKSESLKRQPSIRVTGIVQKCKETFQTLSSSPLDGSSPMTMQDNDLPGNHQRRFQEARCFFQNLEGNSETKNIPAELKSKSDSSIAASVQPKKRLLPATVAERFNVTGIYQDVLGEGAAKTAAGAPLRGVPRREAVVATLHSFQK